MSRSVKRSINQPTAAVAVCNQSQLAPNTHPYPHPHPIHQSILSLPPSPVRDLTSTPAWVSR
ncbi:hypothetical protein BKA80DRAFT_268170 [Phyllosticta citrichinensis]